MTKLYPDGINDLITQEVRDPEQIFYCWVFKSDNDFHSKYYVSPKSGKFYKLDRSHEAQLSFGKENPEQDEKLLKSLQEKFNSNIQSKKELLTIVAENNKEKFKELYGTEKLEDVISKEKEKAFEDVLSQNGKVIDFKIHFLENREISQEEIKRVYTIKGRIIYSNFLDFHIYQL